MNPSMQRREFITLLGGAAAAWPARAHAQPVGRVFRLGYLDAASRTDLTSQVLRNSLMQGLRDLGYVEERNFRVEDRFADGETGRLPTLAAELARLPLDVFVTFGEASIRAAMQATDKIPIVMTLAPDPVGTGLIARLARPGGNVTGLSALAPDLAGKRLEILKEVVPRATRVAALWNSSNQSKITEWRDTEAAAVILGLTLQPFEVRTRADFEPAFASIARNRPDALLTLTEALTIANRERIAYFALANRLPMVAELREFSAAGGVVSYGTSRPALWRRAATYVDKILRGAKPADLPVEQPTKFDLVINLRAASAIGLDVPPLMLSRADEVIE